MNVAGAVALGEIESQRLSNEDDANRTTYCVFGRLPMEVQFAVPGNPARSEANRFDESVTDDFISVLDKGIARLLREAAETVVAKGEKNSDIEWTADFAMALHDELAIAIAERAPHVLGVAFCGEPDTVGGAALGAIADYFSRSVRVDANGVRPEWIDGLKDPSMASSILLTATALRLAHVEFSKDLIDALASMHR